ncbi:MAG TPA: Clp protease N-terminal domain-containing protein, partial [Polyangia bacterium]
MIAPSVPALLAPASADHGVALAEAYRRAAEGRRTPTSADVLAALARGEGAAARLLAQRGVTLAQIEAVSPRLDPEPSFSLEQIGSISHEIAHGLSARQTSSLHLLLALLRAGPASGKLLRMLGQDAARIRAVVLRALTGPRVSEQTRVRPPPPEPEESDAPVWDQPVRALPVVTVPPVRPDLIAPKAPPVASVEPPPAPAVPPPATEPAPSDLVAIEPPSVPVLARNREVGRLLDLLATRSPRIVCLVGDPGSGRSAVIAALAAAMTDKPLTPVGAPAGGISPGAWLDGLHRQAPPEAPIVLDGAAALTGDGSDGPAQLLATTRAGRRWVFVATAADLRRLEAASPALMAALETVSLSSLSHESLFEIVETGLEHVSNTAGIEFSADVCKALLRLSPRYPTE